MKALILALLLSNDGGTPEPQVIQERVVECTYAGFCCQFDWIGKSGCRLRMIYPLCKGHQIEKRKGDTLLSRSECK